MTGRGRTDGRASTGLAGFTNPVLWGAVALSLLLQVSVVYVPLLNDAFDRAPSTPPTWQLCAILASAVLWGDELRKLAGRRSHR